MMSPAASGAGLTVLTTALTEATNRSAATAASPGADEGWDDLEPDQPSPK